MPAHDRSHYDQQFKVRAKQVRDAAYADSATTCWRCGLTLGAARAANPGRRIVWHAGHTIDGDRHAPILAECSLCNQRAGQKLSDARRRTSGGTGRF